MENFYIIVVVILFALAISDLIVGVSNDAVNFLNSAIGSKAAPKWVIFFVASIGVLVGATFSSGMMEVARKGIFHPDMFFFSEIMIIFLAVMITDVILLDLFNTFALPTSTTVSIVFELLGAAVVVSLIKIQHLGGTVLDLSQYINSSKALAIITGILLSVFIAFIVGAVVQYLSRLMFSFRYEKNLKYFAGFFGGLAIASITYFMIIKGAKGASFMTPEIVAYLKNNMIEILVVSLLGWTAVLQLLYWLFKIDIPKIIVLIGTFALAMAFAGNDLVNFIGVPLAGFESFKAWAADGVASPESFEMGMLAGKVATPTYMLLIAGLVMIVTLITSRKARSVVKTTVNLSRQNEGDERFGASLFSRIVVRGAINTNKGLVKILPQPVKGFLNGRFIPDNDTQYKNDDDKPAFDKIRASVNLIVASILISLGTSLKLPLSTTYVTFMVAMGTSLADRAWDRESAVYRISGVFTIIGGWFLTALVAFTVAGIFALLITVGGKVMIFVFTGFALFMIVRTYLSFKKRSAKNNADEADLVDETDGAEKVMEKSTKQVVTAILTSNQIYSVCIDSFIKEDRAHLREGLDLKNNLNKKAKKLKNKVLSIISKLQQDDVDSGHFYVQAVDYQRELAHAINFLVEPLYEHLENQHKPFIESQAKELSTLIGLVDEYFNFSVHIVKDEKFEQIDDLIVRMDEIVALLVKFEKAQIKRIKNSEANTRNSVLYFNIISETKNLLLNSINLIKAHRDFIQVTKENQDK